MSYPGGKAAMGAAQHIINNIPEHRIYVELFAGSAAIWRIKRPAAMSFLIEKDLEVFSKIDRNLQTGTAVLCTCGLAWLRHAKEEFSDDALNEMLIYADPPYLPETLRSRQRYTCKFSKDEHYELLILLKNINANIMISGYRSKMYEEELREEIGWRTYDFLTTGRDGKRHLETIWMNYQKTNKLHDYRFLGKNYREREVISRRLKRTTRRLLKWSEVEQNAVIQTLIATRENAQASHS